MRMDRRGSMGASRHGCTSLGELLRQCSCRQRELAGHGCGTLPNASVINSFLCLPPRTRPICKRDRVCNLQNGPRLASGSPVREIWKLTPVPLALLVPITLPRMSVFSRSGSVATYDTPAGLSSTICAGPSAPVTPGTGVGA